MQFLVSFNGIPYRPLNLTVSIMKKGDLKYVCGMEDVQRYG